MKCMSLEIYDTVGRQETVYDFLRRSVPWYRNRPRQIVETYDDLMIGENILTLLNSYI